MDISQFYLKGHNQFKIFIDLHDYTIMIFKSCHTWAISCILSSTEMKQQKPWLTKVSLGKWIYTFFCFFNQNMKSSYKNYSFLIPPHPGNMKREKSHWINNQPNSTLLYILSEYCLKRSFFYYTSKGSCKRFSNFWKLISKPKWAKGTYPTAVQLHAIEVEGPGYVDKARFSLWLF